MSKQPLPQGGVQYGQQPGYAPQPGAPYAQPGAPPPYGQPAPYAQPPVYQQQQPPRPRAPPPKKNKGLLGSLTSAVDAIGKDVGREFDLAGNYWAKYAHQGAASELFGNHNVVELISRATGRPLQVVMSQSGHLVVDANGANGQFNTAWTVVSQGNYIVLLHNNFNYLSVREGAVTVEHYAQGSTPHGSARFRIIAHNQQFIVLENMQDPNCHVGFGKDGLLRSAKATGRDEPAHFAVNVVYDAGYGRAK